MSERLTKKYYVWVLEMEKFIDFNPALLNY